MRRTIFTIVSLMSAANQVHAGGPVQKGYKGSSTQKSCDYPCDHCGRHCCHDRRGSRGGPNTEPTMFRGALPPAGAIVESFPMMRAVPTMASMPVMLGARGVAQEPPACNNHDERVDELDARVEALHLRMMTLQRSIELQTQILQELKDKGSIGGSPLRIVPE